MSNAKVGNTNTIDLTGRWKLLHFRSRIHKVPVGQMLLQVCRVC